MPYNKLLVLVSAAATLMGCAGGARPNHAAPGNNAVALRAAANPDAAKAATATAVSQVIATEQAFAKTMADRDFKAFLTYLSPDAIFFSGSTVRHGPAEVAAQWRPYFEGRKAPFSWAPDHVEVLPSGTLALSTGPVYEDGKVVGRFNSVWRLEDNAWHIVFDKGEAVCAKP